MICRLAAYAASMNTLGMEMKPTIADEDLPRSFKADRGASQGAVLSPTA